MNKKTTGLLLSILGVISLVLITAGVTYAFFSYAKEGVTENKLSTGTIVFHYDERADTGRAINITNALPITDEQGKALIGNNEVFDFKVTSTIRGDMPIPYTVTVRKGANSSNQLGEKIKLYLTATDTTNTSKNVTVDESGKVKLFKDLVRPSDITLPDGVDERVIFTGTVPANSDSYSNTFELRMWISGEENETIDYSPYEFVLKSAVVGTDALDADGLIASGQLITSTNYYGLADAEKLNYERIAYVNKETRKIYSVTQVGESFTAPEGFEVSEQFYQLNSQEFSVTVNVYANAKVVENPTVGE